MSSRVSTFVPGPVVLVAVLLAAIFLSSRSRFRMQPLTVPVRRRRGAPRTARPVLVRPPTAPLPGRWLATATAQAPGRVRRLAHEAFGTLPPYQAEVGAAVRVGALRRIRSAVLLLALLVMLGVATAGAIGLVAFLAGFFLEQAIK